MLYDKYKQRMLKIKTAIKTAIRNRMIILCCLLACLACASGLVLLKGTVYSLAKSPGEVVYGSSVNFSAKAFMGEVYYEYYYNGKWNSTAPTQVGTYKIRACSKGSFNMIKRGKSRTFSIVPRSTEVVVDSNELDYGNDPVATATLCYKDKILSAEFLRERTETDGVYVLEPLLNTVKIVNAKNQDVTNCYNLISKAEEVAITKRSIEITVDSKEEVYSGAPISCDTYNITGGDLAFNDQLDATFSASITNVGEIENKGEYIITSESGEDVTEFYDISEIAGILKVTHRPITISTLGAEQVYNGNPLKTEEKLFYNEDDLIEGHVIDDKAYPSLSYPSITDAGTIDNMVIIKIYSGPLDDEGSQDVTSNYDITYDYGQLVVSQRCIKIQTPSSMFTYNGQEQFNSSFDPDTSIVSTDKLVEGHTLEVVSSTKVKGVVYGVDNYFTVKIYNGTTPVTDNYKISFDYGKLNVLPREITITSLSYTWVYDGVSHAHPYFDKENVVDGHTVEVKEKTIITNVAEGIVDNVLTYEILDEARKPVTENYSITSGFGTIQIIPRPIIVVPEKVEAIYDGTAHKATRITVAEDSEYGLVKDIYLGIEHVIEGELEDEPENSIIYAGETISKIKAGSIKITYIEKGTIVDVTSNYDVVDYRDGKIIVKARVIYLQPELVEGIYDGDPLYATDAKIKDVSTGKDEGLVEGDVIYSYEVEGYRTNAGEGRSWIKEGSVVINSKGTDVVHSTPPSYEVRYVDGVIKVHQRKLRIKPVDVEKMYDGDPLYPTTSAYDVRYEVWVDPEDLDTPCGLVKDHFIYYLQVDGNRTDVGTSDSIISKIIILTGDGITDVTSNYKLLPKAGKITITPRPITIKPIDKSVVYTAKQYVVEDAELTADSPNGLVSKYAHLIREVKTEGVGPNVGTYETNIIDGTVRIVASSGKNVTANYEISYKKGTLIIRPRHIIVAPKDMTKEYDGKELTSNEPVILDYSPYPLVDGHVITITTTGKITDVGVVDNEISSHLIKAGGKDVTANYQVEYVAGKLTVTPRKITLKATDVTKEYDGKPLTSNAYKIVKGSLVEGQKIDDSAVEGDGTITDVGYVYNNIVLSSVSIFEGERNVTHNYEISLEKGKLTVTKRPIKIKTEDKFWNYDGEVHFHPYFEEPVYNGKYEGEIPFAVVEGQIVEVVEDSWSTIQDVGKTPNVMTLRIMSGTKNVTANYDIKMEYGYLVVGKITLKVKTLSTIETYNGLPHSKKEFANVDVSGLIDRHKIVVVDWTEVTDVTKTPVKNILSFDVIDKSTGRSVIVNYDVETVEFGTIEVLPLKITLAPEDVKDYNGYSQSAEVVVPVDGTAFALDGDRAVATTNEKYVDVGVYDSTIKLGTVIIRDIYGKDITYNYDIDYAKGSFEITPIRLYVIVGDKSKAYDGMPLTYDYYETEGLLSMHRVDSIKIEGEITEVGVAPNVASDVVIKTTDGRVVPITNYSIMYIDGELEITPRVIRVQTGSKEKRFDGTPLTCKEYSITSGSLLTGHVLNIASTASITKPGVERNVIKFTVTNKDGTEDYTHNYEIGPTDGEWGQLKVIAIKLSVTTESAEKYYDGTPLTCNRYKATVVGGAIEGHVIVVNVTGSRTEPGSSNNTFTVKVTYKGEDITYGYEISAYMGTLTVKKKITVTLKPRDEIKEYDGTPLVATEIEGFDTLASMGYYYDKSTLVFGGSQTDYGESESYISHIDIYNAEGVPITEMLDMFGIKYKEGRLQVTKPHVIIKLYKVSATYSGEALSYRIDDYTLENADEFESLGIDSVDIRLGGSRVDVGEMTYDEIREATSFNVYDEYGNNITENFYLLITGDPLEVIHKEIEVRSMDATSEYDDKPFSCKEAWVSQGTLIEGDTIYFTITTEITYVGEVENVIDRIKIVNRSGVDVTENYNITEIYGKLTVTPKK